MFDWNAPITFEKETLEQGTALTFSRPARIPNLETLPRKLPDWLRRTRLDGQRLELEWTRPVRASTFTQNSRVVLDLFPLKPSRSTMSPTALESSEFPEGQYASNPDKFWHLIELAYRRLGPAHEPGG